MCYLYYKIIVILHKKVNQMNKKNIHEGEAIKLFLFLNDIDYSNFAKNLNISRTWLHNVFDTEIQTPKTWETIKKFTNVNKQDMLSLYFRCYYEQNTLQMLNKSELTIEKLNKIVDKSGPVIIY